MMRGVWKYIGSVVLVCGLALLPTIGLSAADTPEQQGSAPQENRAPAAKVSGNSSHITISADHADVLSVLKLVFAQAHQQFAPDGSVGGDITLELRNQTFDTVLKAVCHQAMLTYTLDHNGIYQLKFDARALSEAVVRMRMNDSVMNNNAMLQNNLGFTPMGAGGRGYASGGLPGAPGGIAGVGGGGFGGGGFGAAGVPTGKFREGEALSPFDRMMRANNLVGIHVPEGHPVPVGKVLEQFSRQSGVQILIDPELGINRDPKFDGDIVRPLPEALNFLAWVAHLEWRAVNGIVFVTSAPDFRIFYGLASAPVAAYPVHRTQPQTKSRLMHPMQQAKPAAPPQTGGKRKEKVDP